VVFRDKLTRRLERLVHTRLVQPVIVKVHRPYFTELIEEIRPFSVTMPPLRVLAKELPIFAPHIIEMPRLGMVSAVLPREVVFDLTEDFRVERIYPDEVKWALSVGRYPTVPREGIFALRRRGIRRAEDVYFTSTKWTKKLIGCDVANAKGYTGRGVKVAVLDTGVSLVHEQVRGLVEAYSTIPVGPLDLNGHGLWCVSCIGGRRAVDNVLYRMTGQYIEVEGMAPDATLISIKVLDFIVGAGSDSMVLKGIEMALDMGAKIVSMSLGGDITAFTQEEEPYYEVVSEATENGVIFSVAAGNSGPAEGTIGTPAWLEPTLAVGATDPLTGDIAPYSSRGPTPDGRVKPDVVAPGGGYPGNGILSAITGLLDMAGDGVPSRYSPIQGTSMATPHVSGLLTCAAQAWRRLVGKELTAHEVKRMMSELGHEKSNVDGWGFIDWFKFEEWLETEHGVKV
jgi:subtilisin family serine protease